MVVFSGIVGKMFSKSFSQSRKKRCNFFTHVSGFSIDGVLSMFSTDLRRIIMLVILVICRAQPHALQEYPAGCVLCGTARQLQGSSRTA